jgi:hypothetical protein
MLELIRQDYRMHPMPPPAFLQGEAKEGFPIVHLNRRIPDESKPYFHKVWQDSLAYAPRGHRALVIPHWLLLLIVAAAWIGLLLWRTRRQRRAKEAIAIPAASS